MLSAAKDILESDGAAEKYNGTHACREHIIDRQCQRMSTGAVLLADIIPALLVKVTAPLYIRMVPFGQVISMWSSGTGGAGIVGAMTYAVLTDPLMLHLSPNTALYSMLIVPLIFAYT
ncbi:CLN3 protein [Teladorsagia circumcincta]|uniref:CLN3 protein n=1 Tax=Teladorsagia circumcincta TaxID=45464 RepID=A0A2G9V474_TELCI|nr:CLN3 protein [Teladorsagia circumcincta]